MQTINKADSSMTSALPSPYYEHEGITIYNADCRDILPLLKPVDLVLTDPPYGVNKKHRTYASSNGPVSEWDTEFNTSWLDAIQRLATILGWMPGVGNLLHCPAEIGPLCYEWTLVAHVVNGMTRSPIGYGNWIPCLVYKTEGVKVYSQQSDIGRVTISGYKPNHPCPKPLEAMQWFLNRLPGQTILDPFMGSGTTLRAAKDLGRKAIGIEIEERYCEIAVKRLAQEVLAL